jgi:hemerythrin-like domain-containing protein
MIIYNLKKESNVSKALLTQTAEGEGKSLSEIICKYGLPIDPAFETLINVLKCEKIEAGFKKYVIEKAQEMSKTDEDREALEPYVEGQKSINEVTTNNGLSGTKKILSRDDWQKIDYQLNKLTPEILKEEKKEIYNNLDIIVREIFQKVNSNLDILQEIYILLPKDHQRIPYLNQKLKKKGI